MYKGNDDAFEFFGGTVNAKHLFAYEPDDDAFDFDFGYRGHIQFAVSLLKDSAIYSANPNGIESDNDATGSSATPQTRAAISNLTIIGFCGNGGNTDSLNARTRGLLQAAQIRRNSRVIIRNFVFGGFPTAVNLTGADTSDIRYGNIQAFSTIVNPAVPNPPHIWGGHNTYLSNNVNGSLQLLSPCLWPGADFRPASGSPALGSADFTTAPLLPSGNNFTWTTTTYRGAFAGSGLGSNWLTGWTK